MCILFWYNKIELVLKKTIIWLALLHQNNVHIFDTIRSSKWDKILASKVICVISVVLKKKNMDNN